jgi:hypothetical protein
VLFGHRFHHELEKGMFVGSFQGVVVFPVHFKLPDSIFVVVLIGLPAKLQHVIADLGDYIIAAHDGLLVVTGFFGSVVGIRYLFAIRGQQEEFRLDPGFDSQTLGGSFCHQLFQHVAGGLGNQLFQIATGYALSKRMGTEFFLSNGLYYHPFRRPFPLLVNLFAGNRCFVEEIF